MTGHRPREGAIELLHVVSLECALTGADALVAADAGVHVLERRVEAEDLVSRAFRAALELIGQRSGVPCLCALPVTMTIFILLSSIHGISTMIVP